MSGTVNDKSITVTGTVTGAVHGTGAALAHDLARNGAKVCVMAPDMDDVIKVAAGIGSAAIAARMNITNRASMLASIAAKHSHPLATSCCASESAVEVLAFDGIAVSAAGSGFHVSAGSEYLAGQTFMVDG